MANLGGSLGFVPFAMGMAGCIGKDKGEQARVWKFSPANVGQSKYVGLPCDEVTNIEKRGKVVSLISGKTNTEFFSFIEI
jgi:hypothetical protein